MLTLKTTHFPSPTQVVLIISDQDEASVLLEIFLQQKGCTSILEKQENAPHTCKVVAPVLIVIDIQSPHSKRLALCSQLRAITSSPILLLVPDYKSSEMIDNYNAGVDECLLKPVSPAFLVVKAISWLMRQRWVGTDAHPTQQYTRL